MKIRQKFRFYNLIMLMTPIFLIGVVSVLFVLIFVIKFPIEELSVTRTELINPVTLVRAFGLFFKENPEAVIYVFLWVVICIVISVATTTTITRLMIKSIEDPIRELTYSVENIKNNNLNFETMGSEYEEIDNLCEGFDSMRRTLIMLREREDVLRNERSMMIANISHDLKTPITAIKGYIEGINDGIADTPEKMKRYLNTIYSKAKTIDNLVNNLSTFSKLEMSRLEFIFCEGDMRELLYDVIDGYRIDFEQSGIEIVIDVSDEPLIVNIDGEKMRRVFTNLIENSLKYRLPESKKLVVKAFSEEGYVYVLIVDDGVGMHSSELDRVFDTFYRADDSRTSQIKGNGLGLGIAKQIVQKHKGRIWLKSDGMNKGTTAVVCIPEIKNTQTTTIV